MLEHMLGQKYGEIFPRRVLGDAVQDRKPRFLSSPEQNNHPDLEERADGGRAVFLYIQQGKRCPVGAGHDGVIRVGHDGVIRVGHFVPTEKYR